MNLKVKLVTVVLVVLIAGAIIWTGNPRVALHKQNWNNLLKCIEHSRSRSEYIPMPDFNPDQDCMYIECMREHWDKPSPEFITHVISCQKALSARIATEYRRIAEATKLAMRCPTLAEIVSIDRRYPNSNLRRLRRAIERMAEVIGEVINDDKIFHQWNRKVPTIEPSTRASEYTAQGFYLKTSFQGSELISIDGYITPIGLLPGLEIDDPEAVKRISRKIFQKFQEFGQLIEVQDVIGHHTIDFNTQTVECQWNSVDDTTQSKLFLLHFNNAPTLNPNPSDLYILHSKE